MISSKSKKSTHRRLKSTSPKKNKNKFYDYNNKKRENILAIEESKKLYTKLFCNPSNIIMNQLKGENLKIYVNSFSPKDILVLSIILPKYFYFNSIELGSYDPIKGEENDSKKKKKEQYLYQNEKDKKNKENEKIQSTIKILTSVGKNLISSKKILHLSLFCFNIDKKIAENISQGIAKNKSLESLLIKNCKMNIDSYEILLKGLLNHEKIKFLDLSNNNFSDKCGNMISRVIIRQSQRRDQIIWSYGLRNEYPANNDYAKGLISINLHGNKLGEKSTDKICYALCTDQYLRAVDLSDNYIDNNSCKKYIYMMRKNNTLLTIDLRNNPGYDENIHSRLVMKMSKNIHFLYQQYQSGAYTEEEFENLKDYIEISFFDVDIPQEIVEFYNKNLPEDEDNEEEEENNIIQNQEDFSNNEDEKDIIKLSSNKSSNFSSNNLNKSKVSQADKSLIEENLKLKQQIIELKAINLQRQLKGNKNDINIDNINNKDNDKTIEGDYKRVVELINELNELMNNIENKKNKKENTKNKKDNKNKDKEIYNKNIPQNIQQQEQNKNIDNEKYLIEQEQKELEREQELERLKEIEKQKEIEKKKEKEKEEKLKKEKEEKLKKEKEEKIKKEKEEKLKKEKEEREKKEKEEKLKKEKEEKEKKEKEEKLKKEKEEKEKREKEEKQKIKKEEKPKKEKGLFDDDLNDSNKPIPYQELQAEPSEENKSGSQLMDEDGNVFNFDDLTDEEKMSIIHQQLILQRLQEEAEARGEQFDPQEYLALLEAQAEEEELMKKNSSNKLNKSF